MLGLAVAALACLTLARTSPAESHTLRVYQPTHNLKDINSVLANIEERLRVLDTVSAVQAKQARRLDAIQDKIDRVETTLSLKLERAQLAAERLEHRIHMLQTNVQTSIKENTEKLERSQMKIMELAQNLTTNIDMHVHLLEKVNGAYADTWHRGLVLEALMRDGLSLVNVTRRELADGLRALARRHSRASTMDLEVALSRRLNDNANKVDSKMQEVLDAQKRFMDSCQRVQLDDPTQVADVLDKLIDSLINKTAATFHELQNIQATMRNHDNRVMKFLSTIRQPQTDATCRRLESAFRNTSHTIFRENELKQLTEKFVALTDRADTALQRLESQFNIDLEEPKIKGIKIYRSDDSDEDFEWGDEDSSYFADSGGGDMMEDDKRLLRGLKRAKKATESATARPHRRHLHKHPYDRGPRRNPSTS